LVDAWPDLEPEGKWEIFVWNGWIQEPSLWWVTSRIMNVHERML